MLPNQLSILCRDFRTPLPEHYSVSGTYEDESTETIAHSLIIYCGLQMTKPLHRGFERTA